MLGGEITNPQSLNRYAYAGNNPTTNTDPSGLGPCPSINGMPTICITSNADGDGDGNTPPGLGGGIGECPFYGCVPNCSIFTCGPTPNPYGGNGSGGGGGGTTAPTPPPLISPVPPKPALPPPLLSPNPKSRACSVSQARNDLTQLLSIDEVVAPFESRIVPATGMIVAGGGIAYGSIMAIGAFPPSAFLAVPVMVSGIALAGEGVYYGATGKIYAPSSCH